MLIYALFSLVTALSQYLPQMLRPKSGQEKRRLVLHLEFDDYCELFEKNVRGRLVGTYFGWLCNRWTFLWGCALALIFAVIGFNFVEFLSA